MSPELRIASYKPPEATFRVEGVRNIPAIPNPDIVVKKNADGLPFVDFMHPPQSGFRFVSNGAKGVKIGESDLVGISELIGIEPTMDSQDPGALKKSWESGRAVVIMKGKKLVGYAQLKEEGNLSHRTEAELEVLGWRNERKVYEIASVVLDPEVRKLHLSSTMQKALMSLRIDEFREGKSVFISSGDAGERYYRSLRRAGEELGIIFEPMVHTNVEGIAEKACSQCRLQGSTAWERGRDCSLRITKEKLARLVASGEFPRGDTEKCILYFSRTDTGHPTIPQKAEIFSLNGNRNGNHLVA